MASGAESGSEGRERKLEPLLWHQLRRTHRGASGLNPGGPGVSREVTQESHGAIPMKEEVDIPKQDASI